MAANFGQKIVISMKSTNMPVSILPKTKSFKVLCVFIAKYGVNNETSETYHSGETDEANCSWLHPVWPPPKRPDQDNTFCVVSRASTELNFCMHGDFDVRNNVCKPHRLVCECCRDISA